MNPRAWKVPSDDEEVLLWPDAARWAELTLRANERATRPTDHGRRLLDLPLRALRRQARTELPRFAGPAADPDRPWIVTGHQTVPYHAGVWAKSVAVDAVARQIDGAAVYVHVDHDVPHPGPQLAWPAWGPDHRPVLRGALALDGDQAFERQPSPAPAALADLCHRVDADLAALLTEPRTHPFSLPPPLARGALSGPVAFAEWFASARADLDRRLGLSLTESMGSALADTDAFLIFAADAIAAPGRMHRAYNAALAAVSLGPDHAVARPLGVVGDGLELPFWTLRAGVPGRHRLVVRAAHGEVYLGDDHGPLGDLSPADLGSADRAVPALRRLLRDAGASLRPRAVTLTLFDRLLLADVFVHGIGGAAYDAATDLLFAPLYGVEAPPFVVASATLRLPLDVATVTEETRRHARQALRDVHHNPERCFVGREPPSAASTALIAAKAVAVARHVALRELPRPEKKARRDELAQGHRRIGELNRELAARLGAEGTARRLAVERLEAGRPGAAVATARGYFYGLFPEGKLERLREAIRARLSG